MRRAQIKSSCLGAFPSRVYRLGAALDDVFVERILEVARRRADAEQSSEIGLVIAKQQTIRRFELDAIVAQLVVLRERQPVPLILQRRFLRPSRPAPGV